MLVRSVFPIIGLMACLAFLVAAQQKEIRQVPIKATSPTSATEMYTAYWPSVTASTERATAQLPKR